MVRTEDYYSIEELSERLSPEGHKVLDMVKGLGTEDQSAIFGILTKLLLEPLVSGDDEYWDDDEDDWDDDGLSTDEPDYPCFKPAANVQKYTIRIQLKYIKPAIYRKVEVPSNITLRFLGEFLLDIMGWESTHLWHFRSKDIFYDPKHPYTWALLSSIPDIDSKERLEAIPGTPPNMIYPPVGDAFALRSKYAMEIDFKKEPPYFKISDTHYAATWLLDPRAPKAEMPKIVSERIANSLKGKKGAK